MANDYRTGHLGEVATVRSGFAFKSKDMGDTGVPIIKIKNVTPPIIDIQDVQRVPDSVINENDRIKKFALKKGDILIAMTGATVGKVGRMPGTNEIFYLNQRVGKVFLNKPNQADYDFLYYVLSQETHVREMFGIAHGSAQANISGSQIETLKIPLPPLNVQQRIAHILGSLDDKIELNRRMNRTLEKMAQAIFKSWFIDFDPVRAKALMAGNPIPDEFTERAEAIKKKLAQNQPSPPAPLPKGEGRKGAFGACLSGRVKTRPYIFHRSLFTIHYSLNRESWSKTKSKGCAQK